MKKLLLMTESVLDVALVTGGFSEVDGLPAEGMGIYKFTLSDSLVGYRVKTEPQNPYFALIDLSCIERLRAEGGDSTEIFQRVARVVKGLKSPPIHLPRHWAEYHHKNLLAFFALPRDVSSTRWVAEFGGSDRCARFIFLSSEYGDSDLTKFSPTSWPDDLAQSVDRLLRQEISDTNIIAGALAQEVDLKAIGSASVVSGRSYEQWGRHLTDRQRDILNAGIEASLRIVGPAGSGKTLALCMRALQISRDEHVVAQGKRILVVTHSWAMSERIDGVLEALNDGVTPNGITVFPLLALLELHAGQIGHRRIEIIGDDSTDGRFKSLDIIRSVVSKLDKSVYSGLSPWILEAFSAASDSRLRLELIINIYEEVTGVLSASGVAPDDPDSIQTYINSKREDWMPPFASIADRGMVISVYKNFMQNLVDRSAITTDQFILDSIRVLETFTWRMRKETEGYDYIFVDELQLFDPQERSVLELLGRSRKGVPFITAEDPSQGVFAALNSRRVIFDNQPVYLDTVHRFDRGIFEFINFIYQKFPLNAVPLRIDSARKADGARPTLVACRDERAAIEKAVELVGSLSLSAQDDRVCIVTLGDINEEMIKNLSSKSIQLVRLSSFDDVDKLSYSKKSIVVSPWQFIGGTQFAHVVVLATGIYSQNSQFGRLREMISVYLSCSRAAKTLNIICSQYIPSILVEASEQGFVEKVVDT